MLTHRVQKRHFRITEGTATFPNDVRIRLRANGIAAWAEVLHRRIERYVAKDPESPYVAGRTLRWLKVKQPKYREEERGFYKP